MARRGRLADREAERSRDLLVPTTERKHLHWPVGRGAYARAREALLDQWKLLLWRVDPRETRRHGHCRFLGRNPAVRELDWWAAMWSDHRRAH